MFTIETDTPKALVRASLWGFMDVAEVSEFSRREQIAVREMGCGSGEFLLLVNAKDAVIQSQAVVTAFMEIVSNSPLKAKKIAVVRGSSLTRMQTQRILMIRENAAIFADASEAEHWLFDAADANRA